MTRSDGRFERKTAYELVRDQVRKMILDGELPVGSRLVQSDLAHQLDVSTTPVREALRDLATEGLIRLDAHRGAFVNRLTREEVEEIYRIRRMLEAAAMRRAADRISKEGLEEARRIQAEADSESDPSRWTENNRRFHDVFLTASDSPRLASIIRTLQDASAGYVVTSLMRERDYPPHSKHWDVIKACEEGDVERAVSVMEDHIDETLEAVLSAIPLSRNRTTS
jgi:DNA-binding GntR family transcriptional regulator